MGRPRKPRELLQLQGTLQPCRDRPSSVIGEPVPVDKVHERCQVSGLKSATDRARKIYWSTVRKVAGQGMLDPAFCQQLLIYAIELDLLMKCEEDIRKNGMYLVVEGKKGTFVCPNPAVKQLHNAAEKVLKIGSNFGFSPVDRQRLKVQAEAPKAKGIKAIFAAIAADEGEETPDEQ